MSARSNRRLPARSLLLALALLAAASCAKGNGGSCELNSDCATNVCCLGCSLGPCPNGAKVGFCCAGACSPDGGCPAGTSCDGGVCM